MQSNENKTEIIFYDLNKIKLSRISFFINGFKLNQKKYSYKFTIKRSTPSILRNKTIKEDLHFTFAMKDALFQI